MPFCCELCSVWCADRKDYERHLKTAKHARAAAAGSASNTVPGDSEHAPPPSPLPSPPASPIEAESDALDLESALLDAIEMVDWEDSPDAPAGAGEGVLC